MMNRGRIALMLACLGASGCKFADVPLLDEDAPVDHLVGGTVEGLWTGASLVLRLESAGRTPQTVTVDREGTFMFPERLPALTAFAFAIDADAAEHDCQVETPTGDVGAVDVTSLRVRCTSQIAISVALSALVPFTFDPQVSNQSLDVSPLLGGVSLTVGGPAGTAVMIDGAAAPLGAPSAPVELPMGPGTVRLDVAVGSLSRRYQLTFQRGAVQAIEYLYAKPSGGDAGDRFGWSVAADGEYVAVGSPVEAGATPNNPDNDDAAGAGAVFVFRRSSAFGSYLKGTNIIAGQHLGSSVAIDADVVVAGAPDAGAGAALVWRRNGVNWIDDQRLTPSSGASGDGFGASVDVFGDTIAVSAPSAADGGFTASGLVYIYRYNGTSWSEESVIHAPNPRATSYFGHEVRLGADRLVVGVPSESSATTGISTIAANDSNAPGSGAVFVYRRDGGSWTLEAYIKASNTGMDDAFGWSVDLWDDALAVGASCEDSGGGSQQDDSAECAGAAYVFRRNGTAWAQEAYVKASSPVAEDQFGMAVALRRDTLAIGAPETVSSPQRTGSVHLFARTGAVWELQSRLGASNAEPGDEFFQVALWRDGLVVGASSESGSLPSNNTLPFVGAAYFFR